MHKVAVVKDWVAISTSVLKTRDSAALLVFVEIVGQQVLCCEESWSVGLHLLSWKWVFGTPVMDVSQLGSLSRKESGSAWLVCWEDSGSLQILFTGPTGLPLL